MSHQALQYLQRDPSVKHVHGVTVAERVGEICTENVTPSAAAAYTASLIHVLTVRSVISHRCAFSVLPVRLLRRSRGIFSVATMVCSWLTYQRPKAGPAGEPAERLAAALPVGPLSLPVA